MTADSLDTTLPVETPEGITLELRPAGLAVRCYAFVLDWLVRLVAIYAMAIVSAVMGGMRTGLMLITFFVLEWLYPVAFELLRGGATPGKSAMGIKVVMDNGLPVTPAASFMRNLLRAADFLPFCYGFAVLSMLLRRDFKRLGDLAAATVVVYQPRPVPKIVLEDLPPLAPVRPLTLRDQAAVIALAARAPRLTVERLDELAALAAPVCGDAGRAGPQVTRHVLGVAQWLLGRR